MQGCQDFVNAAISKRLLLRICEVLLKQEFVIVVMSKRTADKII